MNEEEVEKKRVSTIELGWPDPEHTTVSRAAPASASGGAAAPCGVRRAGTPPAGGGGGSGTGFARFRGSYEPTSVVYPLRVAARYFNRNAAESPVFSVHHTKGMLK